MRILCFLCLILASCGHNQREIDSTSISADQKPAMRSQIVPGITFGNVALQKETIEAAKNAFIEKSGLLECSLAQMKASDSWPLGEPGLSEFSTAFIRWRELWTFEACGRSIDVEIAYMLHRSTGVIDVRVSPLWDDRAVRFS